jgi:hypothetical protein
MSESPKFGVLFSVRQKARKSNDLVNVVCAKFGSSIRWKERYVMEDSIFDCHIFRKNVQDPPIYFKEHGNKFSKFLEFYCQDIEVLQAMKAAFPDVFVGDVEVKEGLC